MIVFEKLTMNLQGSSNIYFSSVKYNKEFELF